LRLLLLASLPPLQDLLLCCCWHHCRRYMTAAVLLLLLAPLQELCGQRAEVLIEAEGLQVKLQGGHCRRRRGAGRGTGGAGIEFTRRAAN
jgi:hypothetical protein